jgi:hypothetical protein
MSIGLLVHVAVLVAYFCLASSVSAWPSEYVIWAWGPFAASLILFNYCDGAQNAARNLSRIYLLRHHGLAYREEAMQALWQALIPNSTTAAFIAWKILSWVSFAVLLFWQGWATTIVAHVCGIFFSRFGVGINYQGHLKRIQKAFPNSVSHEAALGLLAAGVSMTNVNSLIDQAVIERRNPQEWWFETLSEVAALAAANDLKMELPDD